jgi:two-component system, chemotaxis family, protein-glutamate methylesterase/glutaminase
VEGVTSRASDQTPAPPSSPIRLLVVDDSAYNRRNIAGVFAAHPEVEIVGKAADGEEALRLVTSLKPDVITLDLEMPRMDGFTFLRILMSKQPTPVIVVSSYAQKENVFKALELGALDFVVKPAQQIAPDAVAVREEILAKVMMVRSLRPAVGPPASLRRPTGGAFQPGRLGIDTPPSPSSPATSYLAPRHVLAIASSTGGPSALLDLFGRFPKHSAVAILVAQHMPDKFTRTFAERLDRRGVIRTAEAQEGDLVAQKTGFVCPGRQCMELEAKGSELRLKIVAPTSLDRYVPSADRLLKSVAAAVGARAVGVVLTGMGDDGVEGARAIRAAGGLVIAESAESAVVYGMPGSVVRAGLASKVLPLAALGEWLAALP